MYYVVSIYYLVSMFCCYGYDSGHTCPYLAHIGAVRECAKDGRVIFGAYVNAILLCFSIRQGRRSQ